MYYVGTSYSEDIIILNYLIFPNQSKTLGGTKAPIESSIGRSEAPRALSESHRSLPQGNPATVSDQ